MAPHCSALAWKIPQTEETGGLQSMGFQSRTNWSSWAHPIKSKKSLPRTLTAAPTQIFPKYSWFSKEKAFIEVSSQFTRKATDSTLLTHPEAGHFPPLPCTTCVWAASATLLDCSNSPSLSCLPCSVPCLGPISTHQPLASLGNASQVMTLLFSKSWEAPCDDTSLQTGAFGRISRRHVIQSSLPFLPSSPLLLVTLLQHPVKTQTCQGSSGLRALALTVPSQGLPSFPNGKFLHLFKHISLMRPETQYFKTTLHSTLLYPVLLIALILPSLHFFHLMTYYTLCVCVCVCVLSSSVVSDSLWLHEPIQASNPGLLHCRWILYHLSHQGSPDTV